jgi:hypothetical protein
MDPDGFKLEIFSGDGFSRDPPPGNGSPNNSNNNELDDDASETSLPVIETKQPLPQQQQQQQQQEYYDLEALGLEVPVIDEDYQLWSQPKEHSPPDDDEKPLDLEILGKSFGDPDEEETDPVKYKHRMAFNKIAFGNDESCNMMKHAHSKSWADEKYNVHIAIMSQWKKSDPAATKRFRNKFKRGYNMMSKYRLEILQLSNGPRQFLLKVRTSTSKKHSGTVIIPLSRVFDAIYSAHESVGHLKVAATHAFARRVFWNITEKQCSQFIETCRTCASEESKHKKMKYSEDFI